MALKGLMTFAPGNLRSYIPNMELKGKRVERKAMSMKSFSRYPSSAMAESFMAIISCMLYNLIPYSIYGFSRYS